MIVLTTLRCPRRCLLGTVVATPEGPRVVIRERALVWVEADAPPQAQVRDLGPFAFDELESVAYGCRHSSGVPFTAEQVTELGRVVESARTGATRRPTFVLSPLNQS